MVLTQPVVAAAAAPAPAAAVAPASRTVLWAIPVADLAGVARHVIDAATTTIPGWRIVVLCPPGPLAPVLVDHGVAAFTDRFGPAAGLAASIDALRRAVRHVRPEIVHTHLAYADLVAAMTPMAGVHRVSTEHGIAADDAVYHQHVGKARVMAAAHHVRQRRLDGQIAVAHATLRTVRDKWRPAADMPSVVIPNGMNRHDESGRAPGLRVGAICRHAPEKGLDVLIDAFAHVVAEEPTARLTLAGTGPVTDELVSQVERLGLTAAVTFPGFVDAQRLLGALDVVVQLSVWENSSYALLDAMRARCGVVASDVGGNQEMLPSDALVPRGDAKMIAAAIISQGKNPASRPALPADWPTVGDMCARIGEFYDHIVGNSWR